MNATTHTPTNRDVLLALSTNSTFSPILRNTLSDVVAEHDELVGVLADMMNDDASIALGARVRARAILERCK